MEVHTIRRIILFLTIVALGLAISSIAMVNPRKSDGSREESTFTAPSVQPEITAPVEKPVEVVEDLVIEELREPSMPVEDSPSEEEVMPPYDEKDHEILAIIIYQEAGGDRCSDDTRRKVGSVFLNRVASPLFPDTFEEVATGHKQYGTLYITGIKWPERASLEVEAHAVQRAKDIAEELLLSGSILPPNVIWQAEFPQGDGLYCQQDSIYFCYSEVSE